MSATDDGLDQIMPEQLAGRGVQEVTRLTAPRILVLVLSIDQEPWRTIELQGQRATCGRDLLST